MGNQIVDEIQIKILCSENTLLWPKIIAGGFVFLPSNVGHSYYF